MYFIHFLDAQKDTKNLLTPSSKFKKILGAITWDLLQELFCGSQMSATIFLNTISLLQLAQPLIFNYRLCEIEIQFFLPNPKMQFDLPFFLERNFLLSPNRNFLRRHK